MTKTLNTKQSGGYTDDNGTYWPEQTLYRFTDSDTGEGGPVWHVSPEKAERSWQMWVEGAPARARRRAENERYNAALAAHPDADDPFARFDA